MRTCRVASRPNAGRAPRQQFRLLVEMAAGPTVEFALARAMLMFLDEVRSEGMAVYHVGLELDGDSGRTGRQLEPPGFGVPGLDLPGRDGPGMDGPGMDGPGMGGPGTGEEP